MRKGSLRRQWEQEQTGLENVIQDLSREQRSWAPQNALVTYKGKLL